MPAPSSRVRCFSDLLPILRRVLAGLRTLRGAVTARRLLPTLLSCRAARRKSWGQYKLERALPRHLFATATDKRGGMPHVGSPSPWGAGGNLLPTEGAFLIFILQRGVLCAAYRGRVHAAISCPERGISSCCMATYRYSGEISRLRFRILFVFNKKALVPSESGATLARNDTLYPYMRKRQINARYFTFLPLPPLLFSFFIV